MIYTPKVTVIMPVYNVEDYIENSIKSVLFQTYKNIEIILVNDGSPDKSPMICDNFARENNNITVIHKKNGGISDARNCGIRHSTGDYILFLDSDDTLYKDAIYKLVNGIVESKSDIVIPTKYSEIYEVSNEKKIKDHFEKEYFFQNPKKFCLEVIIGKGRAWRATSVLYKSELIKKNNIEFPVGYTAEDIIFNLRVMSKAKNISFYENPTMNYIRHSGSITTSFRENLDEIFLFINENIKEFLKEIDEDNDYGNKKRKELLSRNTILYISEVFSEKCPWDITERIEKANEFLRNEEIKDAFSIDEINPYFSNKYAIVYFQLMFRLIKSGKQKQAYRITKLQNYLRKRKG